MASGPTSFHSFTKLPQELRDAIWSECLPRRVVEIDIPDDSFILDMQHYEFVSDEAGEWSTTKDFNGCHMRQTTMINARPPIISRVCRESRSVALKTGALLDHGRMPRRHNGADLTDRVGRHWVDRVRDSVVHLHYNTQSDAHLGGLRAQGNPISLLRDAVSPGGVGSISIDLLVHHDMMGWKESMDLLEGMKKVMVCRRVVCIHVDADAAIQSGLFGRLGEERVVMVDALDHEHIGQFRDLWEKHGSKPDKVTDGFFGRPRGLSWHYQLKEIRACWLRDRWYEETGWWATELLDRGQTRQTWFETEVPGLVKEEVWKSAPPYCPRRGKDKWKSQAHLWIPNQQHTWVKEVCSRIPEFLPAVMFRLCTNEYYKDNGRWLAKHVE